MCITLLESSTIFHLLVFLTIRKLSNGNTAFLSFDFGANLHWVAMILLTQIGYLCCVITWRLSL